MKREQLLKNQGYWISKIQIALYNHLENYMRENELNRTQLAKKLGFSKGYISQVLNGDFNHRISKLVELSLAIGKIPDLNFMDLDDFIQKEKEPVKTIKLEVLPSANMEKSELQQSSPVIEFNADNDKDATLRDSLMEC